MTDLPDVNVLVALAWPNHVHHAPARAWLAAAAERGWATTPLTETGFVRVSANPRAVPHAATPQTALDVLARLCAVGRHEFWPDDHRLLAERIPGLATYRQVSDAHLLGLAGRRGGRLVTFDRGLDTLAGPASGALLLLRPA